MGKILILSVTDHEEHILNKIMETIANEPELSVKESRGQPQSGALKQATCKGNF